MLLDEPTAHPAWPPGPASDLDRINRGDARSPGVLAGAGALGLELIEVRRLPPRDQPQQPSPGGRAHEMIAAVGPGEVDDTAGRVAGGGPGGVVARPGLFGRLGGPARVVVVAAPAGSGKTVLLRSWMDQAGLGEYAA